MRNKWAIAGWLASAAYAAGDEGLEGEYGDCAHIGWNTWLRLRDYKWGSLIEERDARGHVGLGIGPYTLHITAAGHRLYGGLTSRSAHSAPAFSQPLRPYAQSLRRCAQPVTL
jgi:hypothetical protein